MLDGGLVSGPASAGAIGSVVATTLKLSTIVYELKAVGEQTHDLLNSIQHVSNNLQTAKTLRRQKSMHFDNHEKKWMDSVFSSTDKTLSNVAALIEPARVDMQTNFGSVGFLNRGIFVFRDSPKVQTNLARLSIASGSLDAVLNILCAREGRATLLTPNTEGGGWLDPAKLRRKSCASLRSEVSSPPAYQDSEPPLPPLPTVFTIRRKQILGWERKEAVMHEQPINATEEPPTNTTDKFSSSVTEQAPLCSATWSTPSAELPASMISELSAPIAPIVSELEAHYHFSSPAFHQKKEPTVQIEELPEPCTTRPYSAYNAPEPANTLSYTAYNAPPLRSPFPYTPYDAPELIDTLSYTAYTPASGSSLPGGAECYFPEMGNVQPYTPYTPYTPDLSDKFPTATTSPARPPMPTARSSMSSFTNSAPIAVSNASTASPIPPVPTARGSMSSFTSFAPEVASKTSAVPPTPPMPTTTRSSMGSCTSSAHTAISSTSTVPPTPPPMPTSRSSMSSVTSSLHTVTSNTSTVSAISEEGTKPTGRQRGRAWLAHQAGR